LQIDVYCDESRQDLLTSRSPTSDFMLFGGLWVNRERRGEFNERIKALRTEHNVHGEFKWHKVSPSRIAFYNQLVDLFVEAKSDMRFRCVVVDRRQIDHSYQQGDAELGYYKFYYQLLYHWMDPADSHAIYCDLRSNRLRTRYKTLEQILRRGSTVERVQGVVSSDVSLLQLSDLLLGAASTRLNSKSLSPTKESLVMRLEAGIGVPRLANTWKSERKFNVFCIQLRGRR
jgi:hypothetical protein